MATITIDAAATMLKQHVTTFASEIKSAFRQGLEFENMLPFVHGDEYYAAGNATAGDMLQPYQGDFTPNSSITHDEHAYRIRPIKLDQEFTEVQLEKFYASYYQEWFEAGKDPMVWTYPKYIFERIIMPKVHEELNNIAWNGVYAAPTAGTPGAVLDSADGFKKVIADLVTATDISVITTGTFTSTDIREKVEAFLDAIPAAATSRGGKILMSRTNRRLFLRDYRSEFTQIPNIVNTNTGEQKVMVDDYNVELVGVAAMEGSNRWIFLPNNDQNMVVIGRKGYANDLQPIFDTAPRKLQMYGTIYRAFGFEYPKNVWVNNQV